MIDYDLYESEIEELYQKPEEPKVELTIEEAKTIEHCFAIFQKHFKLFEPEMKVWQELRKRIEKSEECK